MKKILFSIMLMCSQYSLCDEITFLNSETTTYTRDEVECCGNVLIVYSGHAISADKIIYNKSLNSINASGNVIIRDKMQNVFFVDNISIQRDFSAGYAKNIKIICHDDSRFAASDCYIKDGIYTLRNAVYTPCYLCTDSGELTWQIKSEKVIFDPHDDTEYYNSKFEVYGKTIFAMPYIYHISPSVKRKSGFLVPKFSTSSTSGFSLLLQYLVSISDSQELILKPIITSKTGSVAWIYYGKRFNKGELSIDASFTDLSSIKGSAESYGSEVREVRKIEKTGYRGHLFSKAKYEFNDIWRGSSDINLVSDQYYMKKIPFLSEVNRVLESNIKLEGFDNDNYTIIKTALYQGEFSQTAPIVIPAIERNYTGELFDGTFGIDCSFMNLDFRNDRRSQKILSNFSWGKKIVYPFGNIINISGIISLTSLIVSEKQKSEYNSAFSIIPQVRVSWEWPLLLKSSFIDTIFTPTIALIASHNKKRLDIFEDLYSDINSLNFMEGNRSISSYNLDAGSRFCYGLKFAGYMRGRNVYLLTIGQSSEFNETSVRKIEASGLKYKKSDIVTSLDVFACNWITLKMSGNYSTHLHKWNRIESGITFCNENVSTDFMLFNGKQCFYDPFNTSTVRMDDDQKTHRYKGVMCNLNANLSSKWTWKSGIVIGNKHNDLSIKNFNDKCKLARFNVGLEYKNECTAVEFSIVRKNYTGGDLKPETSFRVVIHLKNLGM